MLKSLLSDSLQSVIPMKFALEFIISQSTSRFVVFLTAPPRIESSLNRNLLVRWSFGVQFAPQRFSLPLIVGAYNLNTLSII